MKKKEVTGIYKFLAGLKLSKFSKETRSAILSTHLSMYKVAEDVEKDIREAQKKMLEGKEEEVQKLQDLRSQYQSSTDESEKATIVERIQVECRDVLALEQELGRMVDAMLEEDVDVNIVKADREEFMEGLVANEIDFTPADLMALDVILQ